MRASRPTIIELQGSRLGLDIRSGSRSRPGSAPRGRGNHSRGVARGQPAPAEQPRRPRTTLVSRPRSAERPVRAAGAPLRPVRPCSATTRSVKTGPGPNRRARKPATSVAAAYRETTALAAPSGSVVSDLPSSLEIVVDHGDTRAGAGADTASVSGCTLPERAWTSTVSGVSESGSRSWTSASTRCELHHRTERSTTHRTSGCEPYSTSEIGRTSGTSSETGGAAGEAISTDTCETGRQPPPLRGRKGVTFSDTLSVDTAAAGALSEPSQSCGDHTTGAPTASVSGDSAARGGAGGVSDDLIGELLSRGQALRRRMERLMGRDDLSVSPPESELEARLKGMGIDWGAEQARGAGGATWRKEDAAAREAENTDRERRQPVAPRPRSGLTLPSDSSAASAATRSSVPPLRLGSPGGRPASGRRTTLVTKRTPKTSSLVSRLPLLQKASFLRVWLDWLSFDPVFVRSVASAPDAGDTRVYLEYQLPLEPPTAGRRTTRLGGRKLAAEIPLNHRSVVPLQLTAAGVRLWQAAELQITALGRHAGRAWTLAVAALPLRQLLRAPRLSVTRRLPLTLRAAGRPLVGHLRLRLQLGSDRDDFHAALSEFGAPRRMLRRLSASRGGGDGDSDLVVERDQLSEELTSEGSGAESEPEPEEKENRPEPEPEPRRVLTEPSLLPEGGPKQPPPLSDRSGSTASSNVRVRLVHWALSVSQGRPSRAGALRNTYLVVRAPWLQQAANSVTCWAQEQPQYDYTLICPVLLTPPLLTRLHNNLLVVEVWQRAHTAGRDRLVGLCRVPLERLYITFSQPDVTETVLKMKSPVMAFEGEVTVTHPATGDTPARLQLTLAAGTQAQVDQWMTPAAPARPRTQQPEPVPCQCAMTVSLGRLLHVPQINEASSGEMDCFVQYTWPVQQEGGGLRLQSFASEPAISRVNPTLGHSACHRYTAADPSRLAEAVVAACAADGGVRAEVLVRSFYPVVTDTVVARGVLSSSQIFGLVEACKNDGRQSRRFAVPLSLLDSGDDPAHPALEMTVTVDTTPSSSSSKTDISETAVKQLGLRRPSSPDVSGKPRFERDPRSETELRVPTREPPVSRRHTWTCGAGGETLLGAAASAADTREEGGQTDAETAPESQYSVSQDRGRQRRVQPATSEAESEDDAPASAPAKARGAGTDSGGGGDNQRSRAASDADDADSVSSAEAEMLRRLRRPLGEGLLRPVSPPAAAPAPEEAAGEHRSDVLNSIERDLLRLRETGSIFGWRQGETAAGGDSGESSQEVVTTGPAGDAARPERAVSPLRPPLPAGKRGHSPPAGRVAERSHRTAAPQGDGWTAGQQVPTASAESERRAEAALARLSVSLTGGQGWRDGAPPPPETTDTAPETRASSSLATSITTRTSSEDRPPLPASATGSAAGSQRTQNGASGAGRLLVQAAGDATGPFVVSNGGDPAGPFCAQTVATDSAPVSPAESVVGGGAFRAQLTVGEALHLPRIVRGSRREQPRVYVSVQSAGSVECSGLETGTRPRWNWSRTIWVDRELLQQEFHYLVLKVWHRSSTSSSSSGGRDRVLGLVLIDLMPLLHGLDELLGWYNIVDLAGVCRGQMKLSLRPMDEVPCLDRAPLCDLSVSLDDTDPARSTSYVTSSRYSSFPSHLTRYPEVVIRAVARSQHTRDTPLELSPRVELETASTDTGRHSSLLPPRTDGSGVSAPVSPEAQLQNLPSAEECELMEGTRSFLASVLRKNLEDLDSLKASMVKRMQPGQSGGDGQHNNRGQQRSHPTSSDPGGDTRNSSAETRRGTEPALTGTGREVGSERKNNARGRDRGEKSQQELNSRTYTSLAESSGPPNSGTAAPPVGRSGKQKFVNVPPRAVAQLSVDDLVYVRALNDISSGNYSSMVFTHGGEVRGGPSSGLQVTSAGPSRPCGDTRAPTAAAPSGKPSSVSGDRSHGGSGEGFRGQSGSSGEGFRGQSGSCGEGFRGQSSSCGEGFRGQSGSCGEGFRGQSGSCGEGFRGQSGSSWDWSSGGEGSRDHSCGDAATKDGTGRVERSEMARSELPASVVDLIETAVRRSVETLPGKAAGQLSEDSDSLPFDDNLRSLNSSGSEPSAAAGGPTSNAQLFISILQEMESGDGGAPASGDGGGGALGAILARDMGRLCEVVRGAAGADGAAGSGPHSVSSGLSYVTAQEELDSARSRAADGVRSEAAGVGRRAAPEGGAQTTPPWSGGDGRRSARKHRLAAALNMR